jgi:hypothetical protein
MCNKIPKGETHTANIPAGSSSALSSKHWTQYRFSFLTRVLASVESHEEKGTYFSMLASLRDSSQRYLESKLNSARDDDNEKNRVADG